MKSMKAIALVMLLALPRAAAAASILPSFDGAPAGWVVDRYAPNTFGDVGVYQGRDNVLQIGISAAQGFNNRPAAYQSTFYNTQGMQIAVSGGAGDWLAADLYVDGSWADPANGSVRTDMWGVMVDGGASVVSYPIIGFTNYGGAARFRVWDTTGNTWIDLLSSTVQYGAWNSLAIGFTGTSFEYFVNGSLAYTDASVDGSAAFSAAIMQAYNFYGDPSLVGATPIDYDVHWATPVPEPASMTLFGSGLALMGRLVRRRFKPSPAKAEAQ